MVVGLILYILYLTKQAGSLAIEKIRKRAKLSWKPTIPSLNRWNKYAWMLILLVMRMLSSAHSLPSLNPKLTSPGKEFGLHHRFTAYDCEHPTTVQALKLPAHCLMRKTDNDNTNQTTNPLTIDKDPYKLLQKATYYEFDAHQCIQTRSSFFFSCVWASHSVISAVPETGRTEIPTIEFCTQAVKSKTYVMTTGNAVALRTDELPTYIPELLAGEITVNAGVAKCLGEEAKYKGRVMKQAMILQETHFTIRKVKIRKNFDSGDLMIVESSTTIPAHLIQPGFFFQSTRAHT